MPFGSLIDAVILGLVEGLTEFIPVSSTGHLIVVGHLLGFTGPTADVFEIVIQLGAILAVLVYYWRRFTDLLQFRSQSGFHGLRGIGLLGIAVLPAVIVGFFARDAIKEYLFNPIAAALALFVGGIALIAVERYNKPPATLTLEDITWRQALLVGIFQCLALWPGFSRAAATLIGGILVGMRRDTAAEFSFLLAVPTIIGAAGYDLYKSRDLLNPSDIGLFATGFVVAFITALFAIQFFIRYVSTRSLAPFGWYRLVLAVIVFLVMR